MKVKQNVTRTEVTTVDVEFPVYTQYDAGDEHRYLVTRRYEMQSPHVPTFLVTTITETDRAFEIDVGQSLSIDTELSKNRVDESTWLEAIASFSKWADECLRKLRG
jgi:hypothetical protein